MKSRTRAVLQIADLNNSISGQKKNIKTEIKEMKKTGKGVKGSKRPKQEITEEKLDTKRSKKGIKQSDIIVNGSKVAKRTGLHFPGCHVSGAFFKPS